MRAVVEEWEELLHPGPRPRQYPTSSHNATYMHTFSHQGPFRPAISPVFAGAERVGRRWAGVGLESDSGFEQARKQRRGDKGHRRWHEQQGHRKLDLGRRPLGPVAQSQRGLAPGRLRDIQEDRRYVSPLLLASSERRRDRPDLGPRAASNQALK